MALVFLQCTGLLAVITQGLRIQVDSPGIHWLASRFLAHNVKTRDSIFWPFTHVCSFSYSSLRWFTSSVRVCARFQHVDGFPRGMRWLRCLLVSVSFFCEHIKAAGPLPCIVNFLRTGLARRLSQREICAVHNLTSWVFPRRCIGERMINIALWS